MKILSVVGARPNFMKIAPIAAELEKYASGGWGAEAMPRPSEQDTGQVANLQFARRGSRENEPNSNNSNSSRHLTPDARHRNIEHVIVHTGQHYDANMSQLFFDELGIPQPNYNLGVGTGSQAEQTANMMVELEKVIIKERPNLVIVVGDCNSALAGAIVAAKMHIKIAHIEAGLRSFNWEMPEEINRVVVDKLSDYLFTTEHSANENLIREGIPQEKIFFVGNVMIDTLLKSLKKAENSKVLELLNLPPKLYAVLTLHRPANVDNQESLAKLLETLGEVSKKINIVFPMHPRTKKMMSSFSFGAKLAKFNVIEPLGYLDFLKLCANARMILTDSGGIQEEATILKVPCITLRGETERPVTVEVGANVVVGTDGNKIMHAVNKILDQAPSLPGPQAPALWDGKAAERIVQKLVK